MTPNELLAGLPGEDLIREGLVDAQTGRCTIPACLVAIGLPRLRRAGLVSDVSPGLQSDAELQLYQLLRNSSGDAYSRYNALLRQLVSFEQALDRRTESRRKSKREEGEQGKS
jgi:hypothetical protein